MLRGEIMAEYTASAVQTVTTRNNILYTETPVHGGKCIVHRDGSGIVTLRGITNQCKARFRVTFSGNIAAVTAVGPVSVALTINGEPLASSTMTVTPTAVGAYFNVAGAAFIEVPQGCCLTVAVENISTQSVNVQNANLIVERVA